MAIKLSIIWQPNAALSQAQLIIDHMLYRKDNCRYKTINDRYLRK